MLKKILFAITVFSGSSMAFGDNCKFHKDIDYTIDASAVRRLRVDVGAGTLDIRGTTSSSVIGVSARACASSRRLLEGLDLVYEDNGSDIQLNSLPENARYSFSLFGLRYSHIDVTLDLPSELILQIDDGSGPIKVSGMSSLQLDDGSGGIQISNLSGDVYIDDGSGTIEIRDVQGHISVEDGSGGLKISDSNSVQVTDDGSGPIYIQNISQDVIIEEDGSGSIEIKTVGGNVRIEDAGSGSVSVTAVAGTYENYDD